MKWRRSAVFPAAVSGPSLVETAESRVDSGYAGSGSCAAMSYVQGEPHVEAVSSLGSDNPNSSVMVVTMARSPLAARTA